MPTRKADLQLQAVSGEANCGECLWHIGSAVAGLPSKMAVRLQRVNYIIKVTCALHNIRHTNTTPSEVTTNNIVTRSWNHNKWLSVCKALLEKTTEQGGIPLPPETHLRSTLSMLHLCHDSMLMQTQTSPISDGLPDTAGSYAAELII